MVEQAVQNAVGDGGFTDDGMPVFDWALAGDDGGSFVVAVLDNFEQIVALRRIEGVRKRSSRISSWTLAIAQFALRCCDPHVLARRLAS